MITKDVIDKEKEAARLRGSLLEFTRFFLKYITNRDFILSQPLNRESHQITICKELTKLLRLQSDLNRLLINVPPGYGKTLLMCMFVAWCYTHYPDCNFIYISYAQTLAAKQTAFIRQIMSSALYTYLFDVELSRDSRAKDHFQTTKNGTVAAFGSAGAITGRDAGLPGLDRFSGAVIIDDPIKPDEAHSDTIRATVIRNYEETIRQRTRGENVPLIFIGQRLHEDDLAAFLLSDKDTKKWDTVILKALDEKNNALYPEVQKQEDLLALKHKSPYVFSSQYQQEPVPAGGSVFKEHWIVQTDEYPDIIKTFITVDTAETAKTYNDATAMSFWGVYEIENFGQKTGVLALHWIDAIEVWVEPKDLKLTFNDFFSECSRFKIAPSLAAIEKKSTGVTLLSILEDLRGIEIRQITRNCNSGSKTERFLRTQPFLASKQVSINRDAKHKDLVLNHISKITANDTHRRDDLADTMCDAVQLALIDKDIHNINTYTPNFIPHRIMNSLI